MTSETAPRMVEAFAHAAGSASVRVPGGATG